MAGMRLLGATAKNCGFHPSPLGTSTPGTPPPSAPPPSLTPAPPRLHARPCAPRQALLKVGGAWARGRGCASVGRCFAGARDGALPFPHLHCPLSGDREPRHLSRRRPLSSNGAGDFEVRAGRPLTA